RSIAADEVRIRAGIDDVADWLLAQFLDRAQEFTGRVLRAGIHDNDAIGPDLNADITRRAGNHVEVRAHLKDLDSLALLLHRGGRAEPQGAKDDEAELTMPH